MLEHPNRMDELKGSIGIYLILLGHYDFKQIYLLSFGESVH